MSIVKSMFMKTFHWKSTCAAILFGMAVPGLPQEAKPDPEEDEPDRIAALRNFTLEDLVNRDITTVSKHPEKSFSASAAVSVITQEDLRRSGSQNIVEALRMAPGMSVYRMDGGKWASSTRGFASRYADKLLVLIDGRSVYTSHFGGVFWESLHYPMDEIDRIEVIRGPGGALYGDNAVNGVINIITKDSASSQGFRATAGGGTYSQSFGNLRYGNLIGPNGTFRTYLSYKGFGNSPNSGDHWNFLQGGFRTDWQWSNDHFTFQGDKYRGNHEDIINIPSFAAPFLTPTAQSYDTIGHNLLARWTHDFSDTSELQVQAYYDYNKRTGLLHTIEEKYDINIQHHFEAGNLQSFTYGVGYRFWPDVKEYNLGYLTYVPSRRNLQIFSSFVQDEIQIVPDELRLTLGSKFEHHDSTGFNFQPSARLAWTPTPRHTLWGAISRAILVPSNNDRDSRFNPVPLSASPTILAGLPLLPRGAANPNAANSEAISYELGYRVRPAENLSLDFALFMTDYRALISGLPGAITFGVPTPAPHHSLELISANSAAARSYGGEWSVTFDATDWWRWQGYYAYLQIDHNDPLNPTGAQLDPQHQVSLRSQINLGQDWEWDLWGRYTGDSESAGIPAYFTLDTRLSWRPKRDLEISLVGQNLLEPQRIEAAEDGFVRTLITPVPRGVYLQVTYSY